MQVVEAQMDLALEGISKERDDTLNRLDQMIEVTVASSFDHAGDLADRLFIRGLILVAILGLVLLVTGVLISRMLRPRPALLLRAALARRTNPIPLYTGALTSTTR